ERVEPAKEIEILKELLFQFQATEDCSRIYECARQLSDWACARDHRGDALDYTHLALEHAPPGANGTSVLQLRLAELYHAKGQPSSAAEYYSLYLANQTLTHPEISQVLRKLGLCRARLGDYVSAEGLILSAIENWENERQEGELVRVLLDHSTLKRLQRQYHDCEAILQNCSRILHQAQPSEQMVELYKQKGILSWYRGDYQAAQDHLLSGLKMAQKLGIEAEAGAISNNLGLAFRDWGKPEIALVHLDRALEIASSRGDQVRICSTLNNLALVHLNFKNIDEAVKLAERSYALAQDSFYRLGEALAHNNLAFIYLQAGRINSALFHAGTAVTEFKRLNDESGLGLALYNLGEIYRLRELKSLARKCYQSSLLIRRNLGEKLGMADSLAGLSRLHFEDSDTSPDPGYSEEAIGLYRELNKETEIVRLHLARAEALIQDGKAAEASKCIDESDKVISPAQSAAVQHLGALVQGLRDAKIRDYQSAERKLRLALEGFTREQDLPMRAKSCLYLGNLFGEQGMFRTAERFYRESLGMYKELGVMSKVKKLEDRMNELTVLDDKSFEHVQTLSKVSQLLAHIEDENLFLEKILNLSAELLGAERGAIIIFDEKSSDFELKVSLHLEEDTTRDALKISKRTVTDVFNTGDTFISEDSLSDPLLTKHPSIRTHNILSIICAPLHHNQKIIGTLYLDNRSLTRAFTQSDRAFITALTNLISVGMSKAQNYGKIIEELYQLKRSSGTLLEFPNIVGITPAMQEIFSMVSKAAPSKATILLLGESGTGKEVIANLIHNLSDRKSRPFIRVNCAALPESLLESELFGIEEKVASGVNFREGKFRQADGGTIFLDEVGDMSLATQSKVLRILQEEEFERVGGNRTIKVDIRVIAATNKDLDKALKENQFRHDLYYRLNTVCVTVPPLRERREDIPLLISHFIGKFSGENGKPAVKVSAPVMQTLCEFNWPGNVRQLMNVIHRGVIFAEQGEFTLKQLGFGLLESVQEKSKSARISKLKDHLDREEKSLISLALKQCDWNQSKAARLLDLPQSSLARRIAKFKLKKPSKI
ncbi:MAG: sigma 54-interacting transcriptional regulator, partial [candidate division Zixibacteria bacterium]|nr:sigma 54-interacting transcriptional regulator [candidate division Zixibacteria bacterium]